MQLQAATMMCVGRWVSVRPKEASVTFVYLNPGASNQWPDWTGHLLSIWGQQELQLQHISRFSVIGLGWGVHSNNLSNHAVHELLVFQGTVVRYRPLISHSRHQRGSGGCRWGTQAFDGMRWKSERQLQRKGGCYDCHMAFITLAYTKYMFSIWCSW